MVRRCLFPCPLVSGLLIGLQPSVLVVVVCRVLLVSVWRVLVFVVCRVLLRHLHQQPAPSCGLLGSGVTAPGNVEEGRRLGVWHALSGVQAPWHLRRAVLEMLQLVDAQRHAECAVRASVAAHTGL